MSFTLQILIYLKHPSNNIYIKNKFKKTKIIIYFSILFFILFSFSIYIRISNLYFNNLYCYTIIYNISTLKTSIF